jgi:transcriptional regulator with XRE-family HTH domain
MSTPSGAPTIGQRIKALRIERGWSQVELAHRSGLTQGAISHIETGFSQNPMHLPSLARALSISLDSIAGEHGNVAEPADLSELPVRSIPSTAEAVNAVLDAFGQCKDQAGARSKLMSLLSADCPLCRRHLIEMLEQRAHDRGN